MLKKLVLTMLLLAMTVSVVYTADAVIEDEDEDTNPKAAKAAAAAPADDDDYVPSEEEAAQENEDEDDDDLDTPEMKVKPTPFAGNSENRTLRWDKRTIELEADDFDYWTNKFDALFVMIYAPWCGHCKDFADRYDQVGQDLFDNSPRYFAAKIDGSKYPEIFRRFNSQGFPHFVFFKRGKAVEYLGKRETKPIVDYVRKEGPDKVQLLDCGQLIEQKRRQAQMVVYFGPSEADSRFLTVEGMSKKEHRFNFFWNNEPECWKKHDVEGRTITFMTNFEGEGQVTHVYRNSSEVNFFNQWLLEPQIPPIVMYDEVIGETMRQMKKPTVILFRNEEDEFEDYVVEFRKAAIANRGKAIFVWADKEDHNGNDLAKHMKVLEYGLDPGGPIYPSIRVMSIYHNKRWISPVDPREASVGQITQFLDSCIDFKAEEFLPSKFHDDYFALRFIKEPSSRRFMKQIQDYAHVDLVMFIYSPTCKHCEMFGPKYLELAKLFAARTNIQFWEMDGVNNMVYGLNFDHFPTVLFWPSELRNSTTQRPFVEIADATNINNVMSYIVDNSAGLKAQNFTFEQLISEEEKAVAAETYLQYEVIFNETIKNETLAKEAKELKQKTDREEAYKKQQEQEKLKKEQEEEYKKMQEERKKIYEKSKEGAADAADEGNNIEQPEVAPSSRIPGKKKKEKPWVPGERKFDEDGNELFEQKIQI